MRTVNYSKHIWEGWTVRDFINDIEYSVDITINALRRLRKQKLARPVNVLRVSIIILYFRIKDF